MNNVHPTLVPFMWFDPSHSKEAAMHFPNVERRNDGPRMTESMVDQERDLDQQWAWEQAREHHIGDACRAIRMTPFRLVDAAFIGQVLSTLACKAHEATLNEIADELDVIACEVTP